MRRVLDDEAGFGVALVSTLTFVAEELLPKARYNAVSATKPKTIAAIILFLSVELFPAKGFICLCDYWAAA